jgi:hypothetical protein
MYITFDFSLIFFSLFVIECYSAKLIKVFDINSIYSNIVQIYIN